MLSNLVFCDTFQAQRMLSYVQCTAQKTLKPQRSTLFLVCSATSQFLTRICVFFRVVASRHCGVSTKSGALISFGRMATLVLHRGWTKLVFHALCLTGRREVVVQSRESLLQDCRAPGPPTLYNDNPQCEKAISSTHFCV